jgi:hypothetical protein
MVCEAVFTEKEQNEVSADDLECYFETVVVHLKGVLSLFMWNADDTRTGSPKKRHPPHIIIAKDIPPGMTPVAAVGDDAQLTLFTAISAFGDSIPPLISAKN